MQRTRLEPQRLPGHEWKGQPKAGEEVCTRCHAVYHKEHWTLDEALFDKLAVQKAVAHVLCPACEMITTTGQAEGHLVLRLGDEARRDQDAILHLLRNEEIRAMGKNPLSRIAQLKVQPGLIEATTTTESLARRLGREVEKAFHGHVEYQQLPGEKFVRVHWTKI